jgi:uncharacterized YigZ family protein
MYHIPAKQYRIEETIKRSKFIATLDHAATEADAKAFINGIRTEFPDATHNCWAYVAGPPGDSSRVGMSDDGEPHGTAGKPMLSVLLHADIGEIVAVVTRYFGGTKLGTGGLVRAYSDAVKNALTQLDVKEKREVIALITIFDYPKVTRIKQMMASFNAQIIAEKYEADVSIKLEIPKNTEESFIRTITNLTGGEILVKRVEP